MKLYKFRSMSNMEYILDILINERLYCAPYEQLNDPFEGMINVLVPNQGPVSRNSYVDYVESFPPEGGRRVEPKGVSPDPVRRLNIKKLYGDIPSNIVSLCSSIEDVRMWGLYADSFKGIAIELEIDEGESKLNEVTYETKVSLRPTRVNLL